MTEKEIYDQAYEEGRQDGMFEARKLELEREEKDA